VTDPAVLASLEADLAKEYARKTEMKRLAAPTPDHRERAAASR
jgi:hypothetical protein